MFCPNCSKHHPLGWTRPECPPAAKKTTIITHAGPGGAASETLKTTNELYGE